MLERGKMERGVVEIVDTESLVPWEHLLRKVDRAVEFWKLYEIVEPLYSEDEGRPSMDPVVVQADAGAASGGNLIPAGDASPGLDRHRVPMVLGLHFE